MRQGESAVSSIGSLWAGCSDVVCPAPGALEMEIRYHFLLLITQRTKARADKSYTRRRVRQSSGRASLNATLLVTLRAVTGARPFSVHRQLRDKALLLSEPLRAQIFYTAVKLRDLSCSQGSSVSDSVVVSAWEATSMSRGDSAVVHAWCETRTSRQDAGSSKRCLSYTVPSRTMLNSFSECSA